RHPEWLCRNCVGPWINPSDCCHGRVRRGSTGGRIRPLLGLLDAQMHMPEVRRANHEPRICRPFFPFDARVQGDTILPRDSLAADSQAATVIQLQDDLIALKTAAFITEPADPHALEPLH